MATKTRREFTAEFKREAVALLESSGRPQMQIAAELGIQPSMLRSWRAALNGKALGAPLPASAIARLRRELDRARMERDILKKAIGIFSETPR